MSWSSMAAYEARAAAPHEVVDFGPKALTGAVTNALTSAWITGNVPITGVAPTTSVVCTSATDGAVGQLNGATTRRIARMLINRTTGSMAPSIYWLCDRLVHSGGLDGTSIAAQTTNLPTAALTRYTSGVGVHMAVEIYSAVGASATTVTCSYTNSAGTPGRTSVAVVFGGSGVNAARQLIRMPLQQGDVGVRSVESVTLAATTGTVGNFGVTLYKPLFCFPPGQSGVPQMYDAVVDLAANLPEIVDDACLFWVVRANATTVTNVGGAFSFVDDDT